MDDKAQTIDITTEEYREYHYADGRSFRVPAPISVFIAEDARGITHRVVSADGRTYRPERGWSGISWKPKDGTPAFVA